MLLTFISLFNYLLTNCFDLFLQRLLVVLLSGNTVLNLFLVIKGLLFVIFYQRLLKFNTLSYPEHGWVILVPFVALAFF